MEIRRRRLGTCCDVVGVSRGLFIVKEREGKGHGRAGMASIERVAK
jgi:hypothetical protein